MRTIKVHPGIRPDRTLEEFMDLCKKYGTYTEYNSRGQPEGQLSLASLIYALTDISYKRETAQIIYNSFNRRHRNYGTNVVRIRSSPSIENHMASILSEWPSYLSEEDKDNFSGLLSAFSELAKSISEKSELGPAVMYVVPNDISSYARQLQFSILNYYKDELTKE